MNTKLGKYTVTFSNEEEYHLVKKDVFGHNSYFFESDSDSPYILDVGAHIGISVLYFKKHFPNCHIIAFEPNPVNFSMLEKNIFENEIDGVELKNSAIWVEDGKKNLFMDNTGLDRFSVSSFCKDAWNGCVASNIVEVKTEKLDKYLNQRIDLLKIDIEGFEQKILKDIKKKLVNVDNLIIEFHPTSNQDVNQILRILESCNFSYEIFIDGKIQKKALKDKLQIIKAKRG